MPLRVKPVMTADRADKQCSYISDHPFYLACQWLGWGLFVFLMTTLVSLKSLASETEPTASAFNFSLSGFGTLGVVHNSSDELYFHRDFTMPADGSDFSFKTDSLLGLQLNAELASHLDGVAQVVIKDRVSSDAIDSVELFFLRYRPHRDWALRAGRTSVDFYLLSEYRNVSYAYLWSRPIPEFYALTSSIARIDGVDAAYTFSLGQGYLESKLAYGQAQSVLDGGGYRFGIDLEELLVFTNTFTQDPWLVKLAISTSKISALDFITNELVTALDEIPETIWPDATRLANATEGVGQRVSYYTLGTQYDHNQWILQSELGYTDSEWGLLQSFYNGYVSVGYRIDEVTLFGVVAHIENNEDPKTGKLPQLHSQLPPEIGLYIQGLHHLTLEALNSTRVKQTTYSIGARWDLYPNTAIKLQWDHSQVDQRGAGLWTKPEVIEQDQSVNLFSLNFSFVFSL
ncbi:hypothetical protein [Shewanella sp. UCD-KL12]|uniref:hypothetical protein n=1 Tax=Shewanella sp. UCD-KL12 TaxID=1917163 RepID=UPI002116AAE8|nr:hypothetical protein [Shewanella sp. UCD-KL12]